MRKENLPGKINLVSNSKRRFDILRKFFYVEKIIPKSIELDEGDFIKLTIENSKNKVLSVKRNLYETYVSGDTVVVIDNKIFGKPKNEEDAFIMLKELSNKWHIVCSGFYFISQNIEGEGFDIAKVKFKDLKKDEILNYIKTNEPFDKAGGYAIQGLGSYLIEKFEGCFYTIVGFPVVKFIKKLKEVIFENS
ncbi:MAG: Maf family protein [Caldisericia bacterium]|nr:Maf family protein [Caldisericia bacterium]